jgi:hypothetical protein
MVACLPYLTLKLLWVCGIEVGVNDQSKLNHSLWVAVNLATFLMDAVAALIAHLLTRPGGSQVRAWLIALPMWMASGLLSVVMIAVPLGIAGALLTAHNPFPAHHGDLLAPWVFGVVYGGLIAEGVILLSAFAMYAHDRQGRVLHTPVRDLARRIPTAARTAAAIAAGLLIATAAVRLVWACGSAFGLTARQVADTTGSIRLTEAVQASLALAAAAGLATIARGRSRIRTRLPLAAAWVGSAAAFGWAG